MRLGLWASLATAVNLAASTSLKPIVSNNEDFAAYVQKALDEWDIAGGMGIALVRLKNGTTGDIPECRNGGVWQRDTVW